MLSSLSLADGSLVNQSRHSSIASGSHSSPVGPPLSSGQAQLKTTPTFTTTNTNTTCGPPSTHKHQSGLLHEEKENVFPFPRSPAKAGSPATADPHLSEEESLVVFPEKQFVDVKSSLRTDVPSPSTQEFLRQQEMQLRVLQEQVSVQTIVYRIYWSLTVAFFLALFKVNSLLRSQSANSSPQVQGQRLTPKAEAGTNTGQSLFWHPHATPTTPPTSSQSQHRHSIPPTQVGSEYDEKTSVCSSAMADLSMQTATSILSQGVSEMHLDLQSYGKQEIQCLVRKLFTGKSHTIVSLPLCSFCLAFTMQLTLQICQILKVLVIVLALLTTERRVAVTTSHLLPVCSSKISNSFTKTCW